MTINEILDNKLTLGLILNFVDTECDDFCQPDGNSSNIEGEVKLWQ